MCTIKLFFLWLKSQLHFVSHVTKTDSESLPCCTLKTIATVRKHSEGKSVAFVFQQSYDLIKPHFDKLSYIFPPFFCANSNPMLQIMNNDNMVPF